jgi:glycosyltransferase involved in cell wall biosynthesis
MVAPDPDRPLSVVYFSNALVRGGAEEHIVTLLRGLDRSRFRARLVCTPRVATSIAPDVPADVEVVALELRRPGQVGAAWRFLGLLRRWRPDILHSHLFYASVFASPLGRLAGVPVIVETPHLRERWRHGWLKSHYVVDRAIGRLVDRYIAVSEANATYLVGEKGIPARKVAVVPNGVDLDRFDTRSIDGGQIRRAHGLRPDDRLIVVIGRLEPQKGHTVLLEALPAVAARVPGVRAVLVGEGSLRRELESDAARLGLTSRVTFTGYCADVVPWLAAADLTVLPSFYEGLPLAAIESLAAGRPVVASEVDGTPEVVVDGRTGLTVPPGDPAALAAALVRLLDDHDLRRRLAGAGPGWVRDRFSREGQIERTQVVYRDTWRQRLGARATVAATTPPRGARADGRSR